MLRITYSAMSWRTLRRLMTLRNLVVFYVTAVCTVLVLVNHQQNCPSMNPAISQGGGAGSHSLDARRDDLLSYEARLRELELRLRRWESALRSAERQLRHANSSSSAAALVSRYVDDTLVLPTIYVVTPTYSRLTQKADLMRMGNTLLHVRRIHWILVEDSDARSDLVARLLRQMGLPYTHLAVATPVEQRRNDGNPRWYRPRGVAQRNEGLKWIRVNVKDEQSVVYFADDDNTYDVRIFDEMRYTERVSVWPVGLVGNLRYERPLVAQGRVVGWFTYWKPRRPYATDMAGFAVSTQLFLERPDVWFSSRSLRGEQESDLIAQLVHGLSDLEPRAGNCTEVLVWHTRTEPANVTNEAKMKTKGLEGSDLLIEV